MRSKVEKASVEAALDLLVKVKGQERIRESFGKLPWDDDLDAMRLDRPTPEAGPKSK